ncbi:putative hmg box protein [Golovinomyces cichoracearum]|uniref:Putative hmg box protein n=1 Tax=Golovinomyces cichoracearum TaxID=62708 RepID=A0A420HG47_9PEZI|nr:putative hmg box protein [Golovinomyces cichoracearum]
MAPPTGFVPPELPPSVEEAYRAKCIQLKQRLNEVEEANDSARLRIARINRGIQKSRLERAFLLEQLAKRTSTNVEDSEGSPSPPPTPKEKPLRTKRGHRKPDFMSTDVGEGRSGNIFVRQGPATMSPCSENYSHTQHETQQASTTQVQPQVSKLLPRNNEAQSASNQNSIESAQTQNDQLKSTVDMHSSEVRPRLPNENGKETSNAFCDSEANLARDWGTKESSRKKDHRKHDLVKNSADVSERDINDSKATANFYGESRPIDETGEEDVEIQDNFGSPVTATPEISGFTPVNRG